MNASVKAEVTETQAIEVALDKLLSAAIEHMNRPREADAGTFKLYSVRDLMEGFDARQQMTEAQRKADTLIIGGVDGPVGEALRQAIRTLGKRLHEIGGVQLMQDVCQRVADRDEANWGRRTDVMDKRWDGIGDWCA